MHYRRHGQQGSVLLVSLMLLIVVTLLTFTVAENVFLQEKMTNNDKDNELSLQVAESALLEGEARIRALNLVAFDGAFSLKGDGSAGSVAGHYDGTTCDGTNPDCYVNLLSNPFDEDTWVNAIETATVSCGNGEDECKLPGKYVIVKLGIVNVTSSGGARLEAVTNQYQSQAEGALGEAYKYKVIAMGRGNNEDNQRVLISYFVQSKPLL